MFIATINTQYIRFQRFDLSNLLLKMYDHYINDKKHEPEFHMFWDIISNMYGDYSDYIDSLSAYEFNLLKQVSYKNAYYATRFAIAIDERIPELEPLIAASSRAACDYAEYVLKGRFELGEKAIAINSNNSYIYARYALKDKFPEGEKAIAKNAQTSYYYAVYVLKTRFELGENVILSSKYYKDDYITSFPDCLITSVK